MRVWSVNAGSGRVSVVPRPQGDELLLSEMEELTEAGVDILVSLVDVDELPIDGLNDEALAATVAGIRYFHEPTADQHPPAATAEMLALLSELAAAVASGSHVAVHCHAGHGRSPAFAAGVLVMAGFEPDQAMDALSAVRGMAVPHREAQRVWVRWVSEQRSSQQLGPG